MKHFSFKKTQEENKAIYRNLAKQHHPDKGGNVREFTAIQNEYDFYEHCMERGVHPKEREAFDNIFNKKDFFDIKDVEEYYLKNRNVIDEIVNRIVLKKRGNKNMDEDLVKFGINVGKGILEILKGL